MKVRLIKIVSVLFFIGLLAVGLTFTVMFYSQETEKLNDEVLSNAPGQFVSLRHGKVHYQLEGADSAKLILFIPGGGISGCEVFDKITQPLQMKGYRTLTYDLYGRGYSARPSATNSPALFEEQLTQLLDTLKINEPFHIVSMSMGALIGVDFIVKNPGKVDKLILIDPSLDGQFKPNTLLKTPIISDILMTVYWYPRAAENQRKEFVSQEVFEEYKERLAYFMNFEGYKFTNYSTWMNMLTVNKLELLRALPDSSTLLIHGQEDPYFPSERTVALYKSICPTLTSVAIERAGHLPHVEKPNEVFEAIDLFLN